MIRYYNGKSWRPNKRILRQYPGSAEKGLSWSSMARRLKPLTGRVDSRKLLLPYIYYGYVEELPSSFKYRRTTLGDEALNDE